MWQLGIGTPMILILIIFQTVTLVQSVKVKCDHTTEVCDCSGLSTDNVCEFTFTIEHLQTFTRYGINEDGVRGNGGRVWYIDSTTGEFMPHPNGSICDELINDPSCTEPITVDGYTFRSVITINSRFPGPTLIVPKDKYVMVRVENKLASESISVHWHGMHQKDSSWMDGVEHVTQCGILPGTTFTYVFQAVQSGTHWYHSHSGAQRTEGLFGTLIVNETPDTIESVEDIVGDFTDDPGAHSLTLLDWQYENSIDLFTQIHAGVRFYDEQRAPGPSVSVPPRTFSVDESEVGPVSYWSGLINGKGRYKNIDYTQSSLSIFTVTPNTVYRFRLIGAQSLYAYRVSIDGHKLRVIATDGSFVKPVEVDYIILHSGERYDFLLQTKDTSEAGNFAIRAQTLEEFTGLGENKPSIQEDNTAEAILHYSTIDKPSSSDYQEIFSSLNQVECTSASPCAAINCPFENYPPSYNIKCTYHVHKLEIMIPLSSDDLPNAAPGEYEELFLNFGFEGLQSTSAINGRNLKLPSTPLIFSDPADEKCNDLDDPDECDNDNDVISEDCICTHIREIKSDRCVQLVLSAVAPPSSTNAIGNARFAHPVHLHGHYFHVVDIQFGDYEESTGALTKLNEDINCQGKKLCTKPKWAAGVNKDYTNKIPNAPLKDTILIPFGGYAVAYFKPDNPGYWFLHCHIEVHQLEGMGVIIKEAPNKATNPPSNMPRCGDFNFNVNSFVEARAGSTDPTDQQRSFDVDALEERGDGALSNVHGNSWFILSVIVAIIAVIVVIN